MSFYQDIYSRPANAALIIRNIKRLRNRARMHTWFLRRVAYRPLRVKVTAGRAFAAKMRSGKAGSGSIVLPGSMG
jgi:hypothetical protein